MAQRFCYQSFVCCTLHPIYGSISITCYLSHIRAHSWYRHSFHTLLQLIQLFGYSYAAFLWTLLCHFYRYLCVKKCLLVCEIMWSKNCILVFLLSTLVSCHAKSSDSDFIGNEVVEDLELRTSCVAKSAGCKIPHSERHWGPPNKLCTGDPATMTNPHTRHRSPP